jgi:hypothetical protein
MKKLLSLGAVIFLIGTTSTTLAGRQDLGANEGIRGRFAGAWRLAWLEEEGAAVEGALYVRAYNGQKSRWYQAAVLQKAGRVIAAGITKEVAFEPVNGAVNHLSDLIDDAYRAKYKGSPYLKPMIGSRARSATVKVMPRATNA